MVALGQVVNSIHLVVAGLWAGAVLYATVGLLPLARAGEINAGPAATLLDRLTWLSRGSSLVLLLTGAHLALTRYPGDALLGTGDGHLVVTMVVLWIALSGLVEVGGSKFGDALDQQKVRTGADDARPFFGLASVVAVVLLLLGGWLV
ncbi:CopD family protein [Salinirubrum litoreum]|uniref:CopD family protein n=1 Tax=Salinirubrum litoreum TaxID=1126234 RepID=A0ABD5RA24_9EURY|nr:CopD family protein [Salinirubrum litoreum]